MSFLGKKHSEKTKRKMSQAGRGTNNSMYGKKHTKETRLAISEAGKRRFTDPRNHPQYGNPLSKETRQKISKTLKGKSLSLKHRKAISKGNKGRVVTKETRQKMSKAMKGRKHSLVTRRKMSKSHKGKGVGSDNPRYGKKLTKWHKEQISKANKGKVVSAKTRAKMCKNNCMHWMDFSGKNNPFYGKTHSKKAKQKMSECKKGDKNPLVRSLKDPEFAKRFAEALNMKPNKTELRLQTILEELFPNEYKYVGDFQFWLGGKNPDFMNVNGKKKLIELFGDYWHKGEDPKKRIKHFKQYGFNTLVIWEKELKQEKRLVHRLVAFQNK